MATYIRASQPATATMPPLQRPPSTQLGHGSDPYFNTYQQVIHPTNTMASPRGPSSLLRVSKVKYLLRRTMSSASASVAAVHAAATYDLHSSAQRPRNQRAAQVQALHKKYSKTLLAFERSNPEPDSLEENYYTSQLARISREMAFATTSAEDQASEMMTQCALFTARQLFTVWKAFDKIPAHSGADISISELALLLDADEALVKRLAGVLVAHGVLARTSAVSVAHTPRSLELREGHDIGKRCQLL